MKRFLFSIALAAPLLLALVLAAGCRNEEPRTPQQAREEARKAAEAAQSKFLAAEAARRQESASDRAPEPADAPHQHPGQDDHDGEMDK